MTHPLHLRHQLTREVHEYYGSVYRVPQAVPTPAALPDSAGILAPDGPADDSADCSDSDSADVDTPLGAAEVTGPA